MKLPRLEALVLAAFFGCSSPNTGFDVERARSVTQEHHSMLQDMARRARDENSERGGVIIIRDGMPDFVEIENVLLHDKEVFDAYVQGELCNHSLLASHIDYAHIARTKNEPYNMNFYAAIVPSIRNRLILLPHLPPNERAIEASALWALYDSLVLHNMYVKNEEQLSQVEGTVVAIVHTHQGSPPSATDIDLSMTTTQIVISLDAYDSCRIYYARNGKTSEISEIPELIARRM